MGAAKDLAKRGPWGFLGFQKVSNRGCLSCYSPSPALSGTAPQPPAPAPPQASPPKVLGGRHPPTQVHPLLELAHGALALGDLVGVGVWGEARPAPPAL